ncbi:MAG: hypothetical protein VKJ24_19940 [Synechococcales bacterium]|nr:hypothetical protein [Synechococcales bacterium]
MTLAELIPSIQSLSQADKIWLLNFVTQELTQERGQPLHESPTALSSGYGLHDSYEAAAILAQFLADEQAKND